MCSTSASKAVGGCSAVCTTAPAGRPQRRHGAGARTRRQGSACARRALGLGALEERTCCVGHLGGFRLLHLAFSRLPARGRADSRGGERCHVRAYVQPYATRPRCTPSCRTHSTRRRWPRGGPGIGHLTWLRRKLEIAFYFKYLNHRSLSWLVEAVTLYIL